MRQAHDICRCEQRRCCRHLRYDSGPRPDLHAKCLVIAIHHTFRAPLEFNVVSTIIWDERRNAWQSFFNHGIEVTGESLNPVHGIPVNGGALILYPLIAGNADEDGDGIYDYDHRHITYMLDGDGLLYRLTIDGTYEPVRNLSVLMHDVDESMYDRDTAAHGIGRESDLFDQMIRDQEEIARSILGEMNVKTTEPEEGPVPSSYEGADKTPRMEMLHDDILREAEIARDCKVDEPWTLCRQVGQADLVHVYARVRTCTGGLL